MEGHRLPVPQRAVVDRHQHRPGVVTLHLLGRRQQLGRGGLPVIAVGDGRGLCVWSFHVTRSAL